MNSTHYRAPINFSQEVFESAKIELNKIYTPLKQANLKIQIHNQIQSELDLDEENYHKFLLALADDLNTSLAISILFEEVKLLNASLRTKEIDLSYVLKYFNTCNQMLDTLGMEKYEKKLSAEDIQLYNQWNELKKQKNFELADEIRQQLVQRGIL